MLWDIRQVRNMLRILIGLSLHVWFHLAGASRPFRLDHLHRRRRYFLLVAALSGSRGGFGCFVCGSLAWGGCCAFHLVFEAVVAHAGGVAVGDFELGGDQAPIDLLY
jgi:hypothetical protein